MIRVQIPDFFEIGIPVAQGEERERALINLRWVFNCWASAITGNYIEGAPRRVETHNKIEAVYGALRPHLTDDEWYELRQHMLNENGKAYDLN